MVYTARMDSNKDYNGVASPFDLTGPLWQALESNGALLMTGSQGNPMTIGWASVGVIWGRRILSVLVRPSRYSFGLIEKLPAFTVNVLDTRQYAKELAFCGSNSGRDMDKLKECGFETLPGTRVEVPYLKEALAVFECRVVHKTCVNDPDLMPDIRASRYPQGDLHRIYHGEIMVVRKAE